MVEAKCKKSSSHWWWFDSQNGTNQKRSPWLQTTLAELDEKTTAMLKLIEEDADSFAQRAEMYYKKRPELINMVGDFYRTHRLLAERYDQFKSESGTRLLMPWMSAPISLDKCRPEKLMSLSSMDKSYDSYSDSYEIEESDVEDPEPELQLQEAERETETYNDNNVTNGNGNTEAMMLREEIERLKEENRTQREQLMQKDEEKREVIRQLTVAMDMLREENLQLRKRIVRDSPKKQNVVDFNKMKDIFWKRLFNKSAESIIDCC